MQMQRLRACERCRAMATGGDDKVGCGDGCSEHFVVGAPIERQVDLDRVGRGAFDGDLELGQLVRVNAGVDQYDESSVGGDMAELKLPTQSIECIPSNHEGRR